MGFSYILIDSATEGFEDKIKQNFKFRTDKFLWKIKFNLPLDPASVNNINLYVTKSNNLPLNTSIRYNSIDNEIEIEPLESYSPTDTYTLNVTTKVKSQKGKPLKSPVQIRFKLGL